MCCCRKKDFKGYTAPKQSITNSPGHYVEFVNAITKGTKTECNFAYSGPLVESVLLGTVAYRIGKPDRVGRGGTQGDEHARGGRSTFGVSTARGGEFGEV